MGWWSPTENPDFQIGDGPLDAVAGCLTAVGNLYREELGRPPSIEEMEAILDSALRVWADATNVRNFEEHEVRSVAIQKAARKPRVAYRCGDVFAIPLNGGRYGFGRIYNLDPNWNLVEVLAHVADDAQWTPDVGRAERLLQPVTISPKEVFESGRWPILHHDATFQATDIDSLRYVMGLPGRFKLARVNQLRPIGPISDEEAAKYPAWKFKALAATVADIERALKERDLL